jgi:hypothetical protein
MATTVNLKKLLHRKSWEVCTPSLGPLNTINTTAGSFVESDKHNVVPKSPAYFINGVSGIYRYDGDEDCWMQLPSSGALGTFAAGSCGEMRGLGAMGGIFTQTATGGTTTTIITNRTIVRVLGGVRIRVIAGTGVGYDSLITNNTIGANSVLTVPINGVAFDATTQFQVYSGSLWFFNAGTVAVGFTVYDIATNVWTARSVTNLPTAFGTTGQLVSTIGSAASFGAGTSTGTNTTTNLNNTAKAWTLNQFANYQVRITAGVGIGQIRTIASNTATALTVSAVWVTTPDATSVYSIEGNDDVIYLFGNNSVTMYKFVVSTNIWAVLTPAAARAGGLAAGGTISWIDNASTWVLPTSETAQPLRGTALYKQNGRYLLSFRGGATSTLDVYDIALNTWISAEPYGHQLETFTSGTSASDYAGYIYIQKDSTGRILKFEIDTWSMQSFSAFAYPHGTVVEGKKIFILPFVDGATKIPFLYTQLHTQPFLLRMLVI